MLFPNLLPSREKVDRATFLRETDEGAGGCVSNYRQPPHPSLRATFSRKGRRIKSQRNIIVFLPRFSNCLIFNLFAY
jgi:hypothetical protein